MNTDMVMAALNQAIADTNNSKDMLHYSDRGVQYLFIRYTSSITDSGIIVLVSTTGDSYDNALSETVNGLYKYEVIHYLKESWNGINNVELATLEWVALRAQLSSCKAKLIINRFLMLLRFNKTRLNSMIGYVSSFEFEKRYYNNLNLLGEAA